MVSVVNVLLCLSDMVQDVLVKWLRRPTMASAVQAWRMMLALVVSYCLYTVWQSKTPCCNKYGNANQCTYFFHCYNEKLFLEIILHYFPPCYSSYIHSGKCQATAFTSVCAIFFRISSPNHLGCRAIKMGCYCCC